MSGCSANASCGARMSRPVAPEQWPTSGPGATAPAAAAICPSGTHSSTASTPAPAKPRPCGPVTGTPAAPSAAVRARPMRPPPTMAIVCCVFIRIQPPNRGAGHVRCVGSVSRRKRNSAPCGLHWPSWPQRGLTCEIVPPSNEERREALKDLYHQARACTRCPQLASTRTTVVFGSGNANADLMFVGEAPGKNEDEQGLPFVGQAGKLLDKLLAEIGLTRADVFVVNTLKCLRYTSQVQLGDGSWERIGRLVRDRYAGTVMSVDASGQLVPRRVIGW